MVDTFKDVRLGDDPSIFPASSDDNKVELRSIQQSGPLDQQAIDIHRGQRPLCHRQNNIYFPHVMLPVFSVRLEWLILANTHKLGTTETDRASYACAIWLEEGMREASVLSSCFLEFT
jgi:hypothetical protein